jgi:hypothetical protein
MLFSIFSVLALVVTATMLARRFGHLKRSYYAGILLWSRWLPVAASGLYLAVILVSLLAGATPTEPALSLNAFFSTFELVALFFVGPLFLTRLGNLLAAATLVYCSERLLVGHPEMAPTVAVYLVTAASTVVAVLGDKMPWHSARGSSAVAQKLREILLIAVTIGCLAVVFTGIIKVFAFTRWVQATFGIAVPSFLMLLTLLAIFFGWLSVALGFTRHLTLPLLSLPSLFVLAYITEWPTYLLVVPFALCLALSLTSAERRGLSRRYDTAYGTRGGATTHILGR